MSGDKTIENSPDQLVEVGHLPKWRWGTSHASGMTLPLCSNGESSITCTWDPESSTPETKTLHPVRP
jgi:hypothetical protein